MGYICKTDDPMLANICEIDHQIDGDFYADDVLPCNMYVDLHDISTYFQMYCMKFILCYNEGNFNTPWSYLEVLHIEILFYLLESVKRSPGSHCGEIQ